MPLAPGTVRDSIVEFLSAIGKDASIDEILTAVSSQLGHTPPSSIRSYLTLNTPKIFERTGRGRYKLNGNGHKSAIEICRSKPGSDHRTVGKGIIYHADSFAWMANQPENSIEAIVTDPPYGLIEFNDTETAKLRAGKGGVWRIPPSFDGHQRAPLPRFTVLNDSDRKNLHRFFLRFGVQLTRILVPGANVLVASNPLLSHIVAGALTEGGLELRGYISRQVMTMRGGDRPKNAHEEFDGVSVMPRSQWEPWVMLRKLPEGRIQDNLRKYRTGGFRRVSAERPFGDLILSHPTPSAERKLAPHPSLKPQAFMRQLTRAVLPLGKGKILDPFMGAGSTIAAANAVDYESVGVEIDRKYFDIACEAIPLLGDLHTKTPD
ncbi:MAG: DNA methylase [Robiginitomaculum sp.]|nr:MAG: DNA methylase [Robiginitomaculum sp.]